MTDGPSPVIADLIALARAGGDEPRVSHDDDAIGYHFARVMPVAVREAGLLDDRVDYLRSAESAPAEEGFIDPATNTWLFFPVDPAHDLLGPFVDDAMRERARSPIPGLVAGALGLVAILCALMASETARAILFVIGALLFVAAFALRRRV